MDLSSPQGFSVNDSINAEDFSLQYITVDQVIQRVSSFGEGALMAKCYVESAYRNIAVHPADHVFQSMKWWGQYYVHLALPFGPVLGPLHH